MVLQSSPVFLPGLPACLVRSARARRFRFRIHASTHPSMHPQHLQASAILSGPSVPRICSTCTLLANNNYCPWLLLLQIQPTSPASFFAPFLLFSLLSRDRHQSSWLSIRPYSLYLPYLTFSRTRTARLARPYSDTHTCDLNAF